MNGGNTTWLDGFVAVYDYTWEGISEINNSETVSAYPVPANDAVTLSLKKTSAIEDISITDILGKEVFRTTERNKVNPSSKKIDCSNMKPGMYFVQIKSGTEIHSGKFIKQ
ncbi:MAG: T9SS type A sorting domain-containing protein [Bacteroidetes bacterium]|nr:T9SS type A sorting domain-containing protein [Bacteroidota bacterium]